MTLLPDWASFAAMTAGPADSDPPEGYEPLPVLTPVDAAMGPWFMRVNVDGTRTVGFRVHEKNCNANGVCHGGIIATFADMLVRVFQEGCADGKGVGRMATINLDIDYLSPGWPGAWIEATPEVVQRTGKMLFTQALIRDGDTPVARCMAIYRLLGDRRPAPRHAAGAP